MSLSDYTANSTPLSRVPNQQETDRLPHGLGETYPKHNARRNAPPKPQALKPNRDGIAAELKAIPQWFAWRYEWTGERWTKVPVNPRTGRKGDASDPYTAGTFEEAWACYERLGLDGVGFLFTENDSYTGVDLDDCRDPEMGIMESWATSIVRNLDAVTDVSPSGTGVKVIVRASKTGDRCRKGKIEMYDRARWFTLTGHRQDGAPTTIESRQDQLDSLYSATFGTTNQPGIVAGVEDEPEVMTDDVVIKLLLGSKRGDRVQAIINRTIPAFNQNDRGCDESQYDLALCWELAFYTRGYAQIARIVDRLTPRDYNGSGQAAVNYANSLVGQGGSSVVGGQAVRLTVDPIVITLKHPDGSHQSITVHPRARFGGVTGVHVNKNRQDLVHPNNTSHIKR